MAKFILLTISTIFFLGCNHSKNNNQAQQNETQVKIVADSIKQTVTMSVEPNVFELSLVPGIVIVKMTNNTKDTITTGEYYHIEHFDNNQWLKISPDQSFIDIGFSLYEGYSKSFEVNLLKEQIDYKVGKYRIVKQYSKPDHQKTKEDFYVFAEFYIE